MKTIPSFLNSTGDLTDAGERVSPDCKNDCYYAHLSIYHFASQFVRDKRVLDAGSGTGYGASYLAAVPAKYVEGIDISEKAIAYANKKFSRSNLHFQTMDLEQIAGYEEDRFDFVFSSNVLEHLTDVNAFLHGVRQALKPEGKLMVAVPPIVNFAMVADNLTNPYHLNIWSPRQWKSVLDRYFSHIVCYRHWFENEGITLNLSDSSDEKDIDETDFIFEEVSIERLALAADNLTAIFLASDPLPEDQLPMIGERLSFVDFSFSRQRPQLTTRITQFTKGGKKADGKNPFENNASIKHYFDCSPKEGGIKSLQIDYPVIKLLQIYVSRIDLQNAFPEVIEGDLKRLLEWVLTSGLTIDSSKYDLLPYKDYYMEFFIRFLIT
ncbi:2-polyprenyl-3-methyl-5-hydroxy-6-metoxy-1,4-benzoquinol methylase [Methanophagales archaeon]|nr:2-polyprenyl-3-methyl-5-hydroxy-6-metoxy-1,4-benzoquinol methylase [Methanophagales archaeon]